MNCIVLKRIFAGLLLSRHQGALLSLKRRRGKLDVILFWSSILPCIKWLFLENNCEDQRPYSFLLPYKCQQMDPIRILINQIYFISPKLPPTPIQFPLKTSSSWILAPASLENRPIAVSERELTLVILYYCSCNIDLAFAMQHWFCLKMGPIQQTTDFKTEVSSFAK